MKKDFSKELSFKTSRNSGAGGQNVNKVETSVHVFWEFSKSVFFSDEQKVLIGIKLKNNINSQGYLFFTSSEYRTQLQNKNSVIEKIHETVQKAIFIPKKRIETKPSKRQIQKRLDVKKKASRKKTK